MSYASCHEAFSARTVDEIKDLLKLAYKAFPDLESSRGQRKEELIRPLVSFVSSVKILQTIYQKLSTIEQVTLQEAVHKNNGLFNANQILAKYGGIPIFKVDRWRSRETNETASILAVLFPDKESLPQDLLLLLRNIVPLPQETIMQGVDILSQTFSVSSKNKLDLISHETEESALFDVITMLRLCEEGTIGVGATTGHVSASSAKKIRAILFSQDFYAPEEDVSRKYDVQIGSLGIKPFAWPILLQAGKIAVNDHGKLCLSRAGKKLFSLPGHEIIRHLWQSWLDNTTLHELSRVDEIKGQKSKRNPLYQPCEARKIIVTALSLMPRDTWVLVEDFLRYMAASNLDFEIAKNPWALYLGDAQYGMLGEGVEVINNRFARTFLLEYAATLGIIDVGLTLPWSSVTDLRELWGADELSCLSRYDGLKYIRLNSLGEWVLGLKTTYERKNKEKLTQFQFLPNLDVTLLSQTMLPSDKMLIDRLCHQLSERVWHISKEKILDLLEQGKTINDVKALFTDLSSDGKLPNNLVIFLDDIDKKSSNLSYRGACSLIECKDITTAQLLANDREFKKFTFLTGERHLVVLKDREEFFRKHVKKMGFVVFFKAE